MPAADIRGLCPLLQVFDMPASLAFYRDLLGFEVLERFPAGDRCDWARLGRGGAELMLNTQFEADERPAAPDPARLASHADTCLYLAAPDVDAIYDRLRARGLPVERPVVTHYGMRQLQARDPDGYGICFQWPAADTVVQSEP